jgi:hypothetical protein
VNPQRHSAQLLAQATSRQQLFRPQLKGIAARPGRGDAVGTGEERLSRLVAGSAAGCFELPEERSGSGEENKGAQARAGQADQRHALLLQPRAAQLHRKLRHIDLSAI